MSADKQITIDEYAATLIRIKARQLVGKYGFSASDREDIEQELLLDLLVRLKRFDPAKAKPSTFVRLLVNRRIASLIRERRSAKRDHRRACVSLEELLAGDAEQRGCLEPAVDDSELHDLRIDLRDVLDALPAELREIAEELRDGTLRSAARKQRRTREAIRKLRYVLRRHFEQRGLHDYLPHNHFQRRVRK